MTCLQVALKLGLSYRPLARAVIEALECWSRELPLHLLQAHLPSVLPAMSDYLKSTGMSEAVHAGVAAAFNYGMFRPLGNRDLSSSSTAVVSASSRSSHGGKRVALKVLSQWKEGKQVCGHAVFGQLDSSPLACRVQRGRYSKFASGWCSYWAHWEVRSTPPSWLLGTPPVTKLWHGICRTGLSLLCLLLT